MCAELPREVLSSVIIMAARNLERRGPLHASGLLTLARCSAVSHAWRAAAQAAAEQATEVWLSDCDDPASNMPATSTGLRSRLLQSWAARWQRMTVGIECNLVRLQALSLLGHLHKLSFSRAGGLLSDELKTEPAEQHLAS